MFGPRAAPRKPKAPRPRRPSAKGQWKWPKATPQIQPLSSNPWRAGRREEKDTQGLEGVAVHREVPMRQVDPQPSASPWGWILGGVGLGDAHLGPLGPNEQPPKMGFLVCCRTVFKVYRDASFRALYLVKLLSLCPPLFQCRAKTRPRRV
jgi:hypothetical protein